MKRTLCLTLIAATFGLASHAQEASPAERAHQVRLGLMYNLGYNLGPLGAMAKGEAEFDGDTAATHASNIVALASVNLSPYWVEGSSSEELEDSRALPAIWENADDVEEKRMTLVEAAQKMESAIGEGQEAFTTAFADVGKACGGCHEDYRKPED